jgi:AcrR family transcriptional regulator
MAVSKKMSAARRKQQIIKKATDLFARQGYEKVTIARLARTCRISEPAIYRYFSSKKNLYGAVLNSIRSRIDTDSLKSKLMLNGDIEKILFTFSNELLGFYLSNPEITRLLLYCSLEGHSQAKHVFEVIRAPYIDLLASILMELKKKKLIHPVDPRLTARCFTGMVMECALGANLWKKVPGQKSDPRKNIRNTVPIFARGLKR